MRSLTNQLVCSDYVLLSKRLLKDEIYILSSVNDFESQNLSSSSQAGRPYHSCIYCITPQSADSVVYAEILGK